MWRRQKRGRVETQEVVYVNKRGKKGEVESVQSLPGESDLLPFL